MSLVDMLDFLFPRYLLVSMLANVYCAASRPES